MQFSFQVKDLLVTFLQALPLRYYKCQFNIHIFIFCNQPKEEPLNIANYSRQPVCTVPVFYTSLDSIISGFDFIVKRGTTTNIRQ